MRRTIGLSIAGVLLSGCALKIPGESFSGPLPAATERHQQLERELRADVEALAGGVGLRNVSHPEGLAAAEALLVGEFERAGYAVERQTYVVDGVACSNLITELRGTEHPEEIVVVGAHYDSVHDCPAANDNGSGVAATLALARRFAGKEPARTIRFVMFVNEEPPYFWTRHMGSVVYARACRAKKERITAMLSLETIGYYSDEPGSQRYPFPLGLMYPDTGNFVAFVGNFRSREVVRQCVGTFRAHASFPSEGAAVPIFVPRVGSSDHSSFWRQGYPALMVTDTAPYRYPHYHRDTDTPDKLNYERMARVVEGLEPVVAALASGASKKTAAAE